MIQLSAEIREIFADEAKLAEPIEWLKMHEVHVIFIMHIETHLLENCRFVAAH